MPSFYLPELEEKACNYIIHGEEHHHIYQVLRKRKGEIISVTSGHGILANCEIIHIDRKKVIIKSLKTKFYEKSNPKIALVFALLKNKHDSMIIEKATELGCSSFYPMQTERTVRHNSDNLIKRFQKTALAAIKQCDSAWLPKIHQCIELEEIPDLMKKDSWQPVVTLETENQFTLWDVIPKYPDTPIALIIGPEGGFSPKEIAFFKDQNFPTFSLGNHILRAETAAITALAQLSAYHLSNNPNYY